MALYAKEKPEYLRLAIKSMLDQTVPPDEIVIVKDGPITKALQAVLDEFVSDNPSLFNIVGYEENRGLGYALQYGLEKCKNELVARMDTDDISKRHRCEIQLTAFAENEKLDLLGSSIDEFCESTDEILSRRVVPQTHKEIYNFAKRRSAFNHPTVMYKKSKVLSVGGYSDLRRNQDVDLFGRMLYAGCVAGNIEESLLFFRTNDSLAKRRKSWVNSKSYIDTIKKFWKMGYSSFGDYAVVAVAQTTMSIMPIKVQRWVYKKFLRK